MKKNCQKRWGAFSACSRAATHLVLLAGAHGTLAAQHQLLILQLPALFCQDAEVRRVSHLLFLLFALLGRLLVHLLLVPAAHLDMTVC